MQDRDKDMRSLFHYFTVMGANDVKALKKKRSMVLSGCLQVEIFQLLSYLLRSPATSLLLATRDYAERAYAVYNYWCSRNIDNKCFADVSSHTRPGKHVRDPQHFHAMIQALNASAPSNRNQVRAHHITREDWDTRASYFRDKVGLYSASRDIPILVIAMEALGQNPKAFWQSVIRFLHLNTIPSKHNNYSNRVKHAFKYRVNEGAVGKAAPMLNETRAILDLAWHDDCLWTSRITGFRYPACRDQ